MYLSCCLIVKAQKGKQHRPGQPAALVRFYGKLSYLWLYRFLCLPENLRCKYTMLYLIYGYIFLLPTLNLKVWFDYYSCDCCCSQLTYFFSWIWGCKCCSKYCEDKWVATGMRVRWHRKGFFQKNSVCCYMAISFRKLSWKLCRPLSICSLPHPVGLK